MGLHRLVFSQGGGGVCVRALPRDAERHPLHPQGLSEKDIHSRAQVHPEVGALFSLIAFVVVALGGFGSIPGALAAALLIGLVESFSGFYIAAVVKYVAVFAIYLIVILVRPKGLFGW